MNQLYQAQLKQQKNTWNRYSAGWKKWDDFMMNLMRPVGDRLIHVLELKGDEHVLDIASGTGEPGLTISKLFPGGKVTGIDLSEKMVEIANGHAQDLRLTNYHSQVGNASGIPFEDNSFDDITCRFGLMFFPDVMSGLREMLRVLKPGGMLAVAVWASPELNPFLRLMGMIVREKLGLKKPSPDEPGVFRFAQPGLASELITDAGFVNVTESDIAGEIIYESAEQYWNVSSDVAGSVMELLEKEPPEIVEHIRAAVLERAETFIKDDGKMHSSWEAIIVSGTKQ